MKKFIKTAALSLIVLLSAVFFAGCTNDERTVFNAFLKYNDINSMQYKVNLAFRFDASGLPEDQQASIQEVAAVLNNLKVNLDMKVKQSEDKLASQAQIDGTVDIGGVMTGGGIWVDSNLSGDKPVLKEVIKLPPLLTMSMPSEFRGKEYIVMDFQEIAEQNPYGSTYSNELIQSTADYQKVFSTTLMDFLKKYSTQFNPGMVLVTRKENKLINGESMPVYQIHLDDKTFKAFIKYTTNNMLESPDTMEFIKEYMQAMGDILSSTGGQSEVSNDEILSMMNSIEENMPQVINQVNLVLDSFENVQLLGDKGVTINYAINREGYIVYESGSVDMVFDIAAWGKALQELGALNDSDLSDASGILKVGFDYTAETSNINRDIDISFPELNSQNSVSYSDILKAQYEENQRYMQDYLNAIDENSADGNSISVYIDGNKLNLSTEPREENNRVLVPFRDIFQALGAQVQWDSKQQTVTGIKGNKKIILKLESKYATVDGKQKTLDVPAFTINGRTYVPLRFIGESMGADVKWDSTARTVNLTTK